MKTFTSMDVECFNQRIKRECKVKGLKFYQLADSCNIKHSTVYRILNSKKNYPRIDNAFVISKALGKSLEYFLTGQDTHLGFKSKNLCDIIVLLRKVDENSLAIIKQILIPVIQSIDPEALERKRNAILLNSPEIFGISFLYLLVAKCERFSSNFVHNIFVFIGFQNELT